MATEAPARFTQLMERWATEDWTVAQLSVPVKEIADRNRLTVQSWVEDGMGPVSGFGGHLPSGALISLLEYEYLISSGKKTGPGLYAMPTDIDRLGLENLLAEALAALGLTAADVEGRGRPPTAKEVDSFKRQLEQARLREATRRIS